MSKRFKSTKTMNLFNLKYLNDNNKLQIPEYQREEVWTKYQKQLLIDTIIRTYDIPKFYYIVQQDDPDIIYRIADGQQRTKAIVGFMNDEFPLDVHADKWNDTEEIEGKKFSELSADLQQWLHNQTIDVIEMRGYTDKEEKDVFLRMQLGTPLNAAEKRRGLPGNVPGIVKELSNHKLFKQEGMIKFSHKRFGYEDAVAKIFHQFYKGMITTIRPPDINQTYLDNQDIADTDQLVKDVRRTFDLLFEAFDGKAPRLPKFALIKLAFIMNNFRSIYDIKNKVGQLGDAYIAFEIKRKKDGEQEVDDQDPELVNYASCARADDFNSQKFIYEHLTRELLAGVDDLTVKDNRRIFSADQRWVIFQKSKNKKTGKFECQADINAHWYNEKNCLKELNYDSNYHCDHIKPHDAGGQTKISNGQALCSVCNIAKSDS